MKKKYKFLALSLIGILGFEIVVPSITAHRNYGVEYLSNVSSNVKADDVVDIEIPESLQEVALDSNQEIDIQDMNSQELESFEKLVQQEAENVELPTAEDTEVYKQTLLDLYDSNSSVYQDISAATDQAIDEINDNHESLLDKIDGEEVLAASHGTISVKLAGSAFNIMIGAMAGGGASFAIRTLARKYGVAQATNMVTRKIAQKMTIWGLKQVSGLSLAVGTVIKNALDPGAYIARFIDSKDKIRNNGWFELW